MPYGGAAPVLPGPGFNPMHGGKKVGVMPIHPVRMPPPRTRVGRMGSYM
jgi:hypothetical protein